MKALKKRRVQGPTTGCWTNKDPCVEEKERVRQPAARYAHKKKEKKKNIYFHTHTSMHVGMYACMRSESESELANQLSGILRKTNKQTSIRVCLCMHVCRRSESESASHSSPPLFKGVRVISACVHARVPCVCWSYFADLSTVSVCLPVHIVTQTHTHTHTSNTANTDKYKSSNDRTPTLSLEHTISVPSHKKHTHSRKQ
jgi:hypothetical protein